MVGKFSVNHPPVVLMAEASTVTLVENDIEALEIVATKLAPEETDDASHTRIE
jgi:hypothetical protein